MIIVIIVGILILTAVFLTAFIKKQKAEETADPEDIETLEKIRKYLIYFSAGFLVIAGAFSSYYTVSEDQQAVLTMFGKVVRTDSAGVYFKIPFLQNVQKVDVTTHGASIGYEIANSDQKWGNRENPQMITSDFNLINVDFYLEYKVNDPVAYIYNSENPEAILNNEAMSSIRGVISDYKVDDVMTTAKGEIKTEGGQYLIAKSQAITDMRLAKTANGYLIQPGARIEDILGVERIYTPSWMDNASVDAILVVNRAYKHGGERNIRVRADFDTSTNTDILLDETPRWGSLAAKKSAVAITLNGTSE